MSGNLADVVFDYVVVGGGSAGVVIAARMSEDPRVSVLLIEAGEDYLPGAEPAPIRDTFHTAVYRAENMWPGLLVHWRSSIANDGSQLPPRRYEQARIMGGGSSINAMAAIRGFPGDYDDWERGGAGGWSWDSVLPYFCKLESDQDFSGIGHGNTGPIPIRRNKRENWPPFSKAAAAVLEGQGFGFVADLNTDFRDGLCAIPVSSLPTHRVSTARGYLTSEVRAQRNLIILSKTYASSIMIKDMKAVGVRIKARSGEESEVACNEVVVAAGALHTPALLLRAGVGDAKHLQEMGIRVVSNRPGVGQNLQDHPAVAMGVHLRRCAIQTGPWRPAPNVSLRFSSGVPGCRPGDCWLSIANKTSWHPLGRQIGALGVSVYKPYSRGIVKLKSLSPYDEPHVEFRMLSDERDLARMKVGLMMAHSIIGDRRMASVIDAAFLASFSERVRDLNRYARLNWVRALIGSVALDAPAGPRNWLIRNVFAPDSAIAPIIEDETRLVDWLLDHATGFYHPVGTCRMGLLEDPLAVVDSEGRVFGVENLRVVDASLMPSIPRANTNIPTIMMAEKIADVIKKRSKRNIVKEPSMAGL